MAFSWRGNVKLATQFAVEHNMILKRDVNEFVSIPRYCQLCSGESLRKCLELICRCREVLLAGRDMSSYSFQLF